MSEEIGLNTDWHLNEKSDFLPAFIAMQPDLKPLPPDKDNPFAEARYRTYAGWLMEIKPVLAQHGFGLITTVKHTPEYVIVFTRLYYQNGEYLAATSKVRPTKLHKANETQMLGASQSYVQRYHMLALLQLATENDDNEALMGEDAEDESDMIEDHQRRQHTSQTRQPDKPGPDPARQEVIDQISKVIHGPEFPEDDKYRSTVRSLIQNTQTLDGLRSVLKDVEKERDRREAEIEKAGKAEEQQEDLI